ncbi:membrane progestin receptor alpha [Plakobranchus ocellatus]|uniref:Membrane progestin receptor alpha n=1 Tax=Plakobranchus ocellatus TaxID=259542 RepID=A0AAV3YXS9_9GAST|nr:membrane progestin receptor alpha [Plakobranchus ocellatus]
MSLIFSQLRLMMDQLVTKKDPGCSCSHKYKQLLTVEDVPDVLKEPYIYSGYRLLDRPWTYYLKSLFTLHNESINVWTHGLGFFIMLYSLSIYLGQLDMQTDTHAWPVFVFGVCCLSNLALSAIAHLFHSKSRWHHFAFFLLDYMGVTFHAFGSGVGSMFICSTKVFHDLFSKWFLPVNVLLSWFAFYACCVAKVNLAHNNSQRKGLMVAGVLCQAVVVSLPAVSRYVDCLLNPTCNIQDLNHLTIVFMLLITCAILFAGHVPESLWPGHFDVLGHGHQFFHITVVVTMLAQVWAIDIDVNLVKIARQLDKPNTSGLLLSLLALVALETTTFVYYMRLVVFRRLSTDIPRQLVTQGLGKANSDAFLKQADHATNGKNLADDGKNLVGNGEIDREKRKEMKKGL